MFDKWDKSEFIRLKTKDIYRKVRDKPAPYMIRCVHNHCKNTTSQLPQSPSATT